MGCVHALVLTLVLASPLPAASLRHPSSKEVSSTREASQRSDPPSYQGRREALTESPLPDAASITPPSGYSQGGFDGEAGENNTTLTANSSISSAGEAEAKGERPRAIVDVRKEGVRGEVSYIIHPDNQPPPTYQPLQDLPPPVRPVAKWRPDIFMKICCSDSESDPDPPSSLEVSSSDALVNPPALTSPDGQEGEPTEHPWVAVGDEDEREDGGNITVVEDAGEDNSTTVVPEEGDYTPSTQRSSGNAAENILVSLNTSAARPDTASNHTPRYEEAGSSPLHDVTAFLKDIANSEGFQNAFLGDLIKNFGNLDQNAMKLIYSLLIRPLEAAQVSHKEDRVGEADLLPDSSSMVLTKDRLPLRDRPANGYHPLKTSFLQDRPPGGPRSPIRPSLPVRQAPPLRSSDEAWRPGRTYDRPPTVGRRGDEGVDVITAPPYKTFEVVLGSSLNHSNKKTKDGGRPRPTPDGAPPLPFDKLTLGLEMPPPEALEALPPGSILIPPSHILGRPKLPKILPQQGGGSPDLEMPLAEFLPNLPFLNKPARFRPPAQPQLQDIPPRLPGFLSSLLPEASPPRAVRPPSTVLQPPKLPSPLRPSGPPRPSSPPSSSRPPSPPRRVDTMFNFPYTRQPKGPPPIVTKITPPSVPAAPTSLRPLHHPGAAPGSPPVLPFLSVPPPPHPHLHSHSPPPHPHQPPPHPHQPPPHPHQHSLPPPPDTLPLPSRDGVLSTKDREYFADSPVSFGDFGGMREDDRAPDYVADRNEDYRLEEERAGHHRPPHPLYYSDMPSDYPDSYYDLDYREYYQDEGRDTAGGELPASVNSTFNEGHFVHEASATFHAAGEANPPTSVLPTATESPSLGDQFSEDFHSLGNDYPAGDVALGHRPNLDDLLGVVKPSLSTQTVMKQKDKDEIFLQNHQPSAAPAGNDGRVINLQPGSSERAEQRPPHTAQDGAALSPGETSTDSERDQAPVTGPSGGFPAEEERSQHDTAVSHLWKNLQLIPLAPELFVTPRAREDDDSVNLTSLFDAAVPLAPDAALDHAPDLSSDVDRISVDNSGVHVIVTEEVLEGSDTGDAKFMAYVLIGACCGLALLSITGVIVIVRFKKTCGSRQIKTRTRLTEQDSVENISRHVHHLAAGEESGHKLGSWFTGRNEHIGSGKLRGNMALPTVHDHKREKKGHSSSTRDLLSLSSQSSRASSPPQDQRDGEAGACTEEDEPPRSSWLHGEYRASLDDLSQAASQDPAFRPQQYQQPRASPHAAQVRHHPADHHRYRAESTVEADSPPRTSRERRYTEQSREGERLPRSPSRRGPRYVSSMDSEELEERLAGHSHTYHTDSELDDSTTHYDGESREPSRYFSDSRELDDIVGSRRVDPQTMTSQELGEHLSRDLKQYQSRRGSRPQHQRHVEDQLDPRDAPGRAESSSQELEGEESRELRRSQSQVSFSRDNVQNEVFLEFDSMLRQQGQYLASDPPASTLGRASHLTNDTRLSTSRANTPDSIDLPEDYPQDSCSPRENEHLPPSPPTTPPRFSPPPAPPRPPKPGHLSQSSTPSPQTSRGRPPSPGQSPPSPPTSSQRPVYWTSEEERLI